jgi:hypothetical protein
VAWPPWAAGSEGQENGHQNKNFNIKKLCAQKMVVVVVVVEVVVVVIVLVVMVVVIVVVVTQVSIGHVNPEEQNRFYKKIHSIKAANVQYKVTQTTVK